MKVGIMNASASSKNQMTRSTYIIWCYLPLIPKLTTTRRLSRYIVLIK